MSSIAGNHFSEASSTFEVAGVADAGLWNFAGPNSGTSTVSSVDGGVSAFLATYPGDRTCLMAFGGGHTQPTPGVTYTLSFWWMANAAVTAPPIVQFLDFTGGLSVFPSYPSTALPVGWTAGVWYQRDITFVWPALKTNSQAQLRAAVPTTTATTYFDFVCLRTSSTLPTPVPNIYADGSTSTTGTATATIGHPATATGSTSTTGTASATVETSAAATGSTATAGAADTLRTVETAAAGSTTTAVTIRRAGVPWVAPTTARDVPYVKVEAALSQPFDTPVDELTWTRVDEECCVRSIGSREGRDARIDEVEPGEFDVVFDNRTAAMDPSNDQSPWWLDGAPGIDYGTRVRITLYETADDLDDDVDGVVLCVAMVRRMFPEWELGDAVMRVEMVDDLARLASLDAGRRVSLYDLQTTAAVKNVWPLDTTGTVVADVKGGNDGVWSTGVDVGAAILPYDSSPASVVGPSPIRAELSVGTLGNTAGNRWVFAVWVKLDPDTTADGDRIMSLGGPTAHAITITANMPAGTLTITGTGGTPVVSSVVVDGELHLLRLNRVQSPERYLLQVDDDLGGAALQSSPLGLTLDTIYLGSTSLPPAGLYSLAVLTDETLAPGSSTVLLNDLWEWVHTPWLGDTGATRFQRVCTIAGLGSAVEGTGSKDVIPGGDDLSSANALEHVIACANGDGAILTVDHDAGGIPLYRIVDTGDPVAWFDTQGAVGVPVTELAPVYGVDRLAHAVEVEYGTDDTKVIAASSRPYPSAPTLRVATKLSSAGDAGTRADTILAEREVPRMLVPTMQLAARDGRVPWAALFMRPGDLAGVIAHPPGRAEFVQTATVERVEHVIDYQAKSWTVRYGLDRVAQWITWEDVIDGYATWSALIAAFPTWGDLLASGAPNPPGP